MKTRRGYKNLGDAFRATEGCHGFRPTPARAGSKDRRLTIDASADGHHRDETCPAKSATSESTTSTTPAPTVIKIESAIRRSFTSPPITPILRYLAKHCLSANLSSSFTGEQFTDSLVKGLGFSLGVATTYAIFSNIDWDDDDDWNHHHDDDWNHGGYNRNGDNNININVENFNKISGQRL